MTLHINFNTTFGTLTRLSTNPLEMWLAYVAASEQEKAKARIQTAKQDPDGDKWAPWRPSTVRYRRAKGNEGRGLLYDEGNLLANIISKSDAHSAEIGVDSSIEYAPWLQSGTEDMTARQYLGWSRTGLAELEVSAANYLARLK